MSMDKKTLRCQIRQKKLELSSETILSASRNLTAQFLAHPLYRQAKTIYGYLPYNQEVRTWALLEQALKDLTDCLKPGGRICVITFHSLEDRIVKRCFRTLENPCICPPKAPVCTCGRKPVVKVLAGGAVAPSAAETERNPRSRSAKLRVAEKKETEELI